MRTLLAALAGLTLATLSLAAHAADEKKVVIAYQTGAVPYFVGIANGDIAKKTGWDIEFRRFNSGADIFAAIASGDVQIGDVGSSPFAAAVSRGIDVKAFYISFVAGDGEALVVRPDINSPADLKGKKLAAAPVSTDHYQLLAVLKQEGIGESDAQVIAIPQPEIVAAWKRGDIDGAFVWDPALAEFKKDGKVLLTAGQVAERGAPTFSALVATGEFAKAHPEFVSQYTRLVDGYSSPTANKSAWGPDSDNAKLIAKLQGGTPAENSEQLKSTIVVPLDEQTSDKVAGRRREERRRQDPQGHCRFPEGSAQDHGRQGRLRRVRRSAIRRSRKGFQTDPRLTVGVDCRSITVHASHGKPGVTMLRCRDATVPIRPPTASSSRRSIAFRWTCRPTPSSLRSARRLRQVDAAQRDRRLPAAYPGSITLDGSAISAPAGTGAWSSRRTRCCPG